MRRLSARSLRSRSDDAPVNPMDSISNLADAMLVLAVGIMLALIINWNVDISSAGQTADTPADPAISFVQDDLTESQSSAGTIEGDLTEMGKVVLGGGGTIAKYMANRNIDTIDAGVPVLSMHAPFEVVSKLDCYMTYKGVRAAYCDE